MDAAKAGLAGYGRYCRPYNCRVIELSNVTFGPAGNQLFEGLNWKIDDPGRYLLLGTNGSGKSAVCSMLRGTAKPASGAVEIDGEPAGRGRKATSFYACARDAPPEGETVWDYLQVEARNSGCSQGDLRRSWDQISELYPGGRELPLHSISHGQYLLLHVVLACLIPTRVVLLDGHLTFFNSNFCSVTENLLATSPVAEDRFIVFTSNRYACFLPQMSRCFALTNATPRRILALDDGLDWQESSQQAGEGLVSVVYREEWIDQTSLVSGGNFQVVSQSDSLLRLRLTGSLDGMLEELEALGITAVQINWET